MPPMPEVVLVRHGETEWTISRQHTGTTDIPLTATGRREAQVLGRRLAGERFARVLSSPLSRALDTARGVLAGAPAAGPPVDVEVEVRPELREWEYGDYEGRTSADIRRDRPDWLLWRDGVPGGETGDQVAARVDRVIADIRAGDGPVAVFAHGHLLRVFAARWIDQPVAFGAHLTLGPASLCRLAAEHGMPAITLWNDRSHLPG